MGVKKTYEKEVSLFKKLFDKIFNLVNLIFYVVFDSWDIQCETSEPDPPGTEWRPTFEPTHTSKRETVGRRALTKRHCDLPMRLVKWQVKYPNGKIRRMNFFGSTWICQHCGRRRVPVPDN